MRYLTHINNSKELFAKYKYHKHLLLLVYKKIKIYFF